MPEYRNKINGAQTLIFYSALDPSLWSRALQTGMNDTCLKRHRNGSKVLREIGVCVSFILFIYITMGQLFF